MMQLNLDKNKKYLLACSYGPDSMALFSLLLNQGYDFVVAHVNYHARSTSDEEQKGLESYCLKKDIPFEVLDFRTSIKRNFEETAREIRYDFFKELYEKHHVDYLLTGHQLDDHIETYYLQKQRKNLVNYYGIKSATTIKGMKVLRPLLNFEKKALQAYCDDNNIPYAIDQSNLQPIYERNKIRIDIVSKMTLEEKISVSKEIDDKNKELKRLLNKISKVPNDILSLKGLSNIKFAYYLFRQIRRINPNYEATYKFSLEVRKILDSNKPNVQINLKCGVVIEKEYDNLLIYKKGEFKGFDYLIINKCPFIFQPSSSPCICSSFSQGPFPSAVSPQP